MPVVSSHPRRSLSIAAVLLGGWLLGPWNAMAVRAQSQPAPRLLYRLETNCSVTDVQNRCTVEAFDGSSSTVYRTTLKGETISFRLIDEPERRGAQLWDGQTRSWVALDELSMDFTSNELCINGQQLCMINPNYFASIRDDHPSLRSDLIVARFDAKDGRLAAICYSRQACENGF